jgi:hypothetical protein
VDAYLDQLMNPPFAKDPPVKLDIPAKTLGLVYAILGGIFGLFGLFAVVAFFGLSTLATVSGVGGVWFLLLIGSLVSEAGTLLAAWGGYRMYQEDRGGKRPVVLGLAITVVGGLVSALGAYGGGLPGWILSAAITFVLYYLVIISKFSDEQKTA